MTTPNRQSEARKLAEDLLGDIELSRVGAEQVLLKAVRLARLMNDEISLRWLQLELHGYEFTDETRERLKQTNRLIQIGKQERAYTMGLGAIEASAAAEQARLKALNTPSLSGEYLAVALDRVHAQVNGASKAIMQYGKIRSAVLAEIYSFATGTLYELVFSQSQEELFTSARREIDATLAPLSSKALEKIESIVERLNAGDAEAVSQAMSTCRRLIDSFADAVFPARSEPVLIEGQPMEVKRSQVLNRIDAFVRSRTASKSRQQRLRQVLRGIYERVSTGVHSDVTAVEARFLFLETYVVLGEILGLASVDELPAAAAKGGESPPTNVASSDSEGP